MKDRGMKERELFSLENSFLNIVSPFNLIYKRVCLGFFYFILLSYLYFFPNILRSIVMHAN